MFGKKQELTKELENKLNHTQFELEGLKSRINRIHGHTQQILPLFETQIIAQSGMDKELTKVVSHAYDTIEEVDESTKVMEQLAMELTAMRGQLEDEEQVLECTMPAVLTTLSGMNKPRYMNCVDIVDSFNKPVQTMTFDDLDLPLEVVGLAGSPTKVHATFTKEVSAKTETFDLPAAETAEKIAAALKEKQLIKK